MTVMEHDPDQAYRTPVSLRRHPLHRFAGRAHEVLDDLDDAAFFGLTTDERSETLADLVRLRDRLDARVLALVADADRSAVASDVGATSTAGWVRDATGLTAAESRRLVRHAQQLDDHDPVVAALADGDLHTDQALVIAAAVDALPEEVQEHRHAARAHLLDLAQSFDASALRGLARHLVEVVAPDLADELLARRLEAEERAAMRRASLTTWSDGHGSRHGRFVLPELHAQILDTLLTAVANPQRPDALDRSGSLVETAGQAFCELLERYPTDGLPETGGSAVTVVVTMELGTLLGGLRAATILGADVLISPGEARRLAASAGVIPAVLGGRSEVLDLGRKRRLFSRKQRLALALRQRGLCNVDGCDRPTTWCDANHREPWRTRGPTDLRNGELICPRHHTLVHQGFDYPRRS